MHSAKPKKVSFFDTGKGMGRWGYGEMGRWGDGEMGRWVECPETRCLMNTHGHGRNLSGLDETNGDLISLISF